LVAFVKTVHTTIFAVELASILWLVVSGLIGRRDRTVAVAAETVALESAVFVANAGVCPLTPLAERLGSRHGQVSDMFLPDAVARTIPIWSSALIVLAIGLHVRSVLTSARASDQPTGTWPRARTGSRICESDTPRPYSRN
jgi:hypothetical protein